MTDLSASTIAAALERLQADAATFDTALNAQGDAALLRPLLHSLLDAEHTLLKAEADMGLVADMLRRDQKFAPPGRPSVHLVQLRKQQATAKQAALVARQAHARAAQDFARAANLQITDRRTPIVAAAKWLQQTLR